MSSINYKVLSVSGINTEADQENLFRVQHLPHQTLSPEMFAKRIAMTTRFSEADAVAGMVAFGEEFLYDLSCGYRIDLGPLGTFRLKLRLKNQQKDPQDIGHSDIAIAGIEYTPDNRLLSKLRANACFHHQTQEDFLAGFSQEDRKRNILRLLKEHQSLPITNLRLANHTTPKKTLEDIGQLIEEGVVTTLITGRARYYLLTEKGKQLV